MFYGLNWWTWFNRYACLTARGGLVIYTPKSGCKFASQIIMPSMSWKWGRDKWWRYLEASGFFLSFHAIDTSQEERTFGDCKSLKRSEKRRMNINSSAFLLFSFMPFLPHLPKHVSQHQNNVCRLRNGPRYGIRWSSGTRSQSSIPWRFYQMETANVMNSFWSTDLKATGRKSPRYRCFEGAALKGKGNDHGNIKPAYNIHKCLTSSQVSQVRMMCLLTSAVASWAVCSMNTEDLD